MDAVIRLSASGVAAYRECNYRYARDYVDRLPQEEREPVAALALGDAVHKAIATFFRNGAWVRQSGADLLLHLHKHWDKKAYLDTITEHLSRRRAEEMILRFHRTPYPQEVGQELGVECRAAWERPRKGIIATGRLDRVCLQKDGMLEVIDYKTGLWRLSPEQLKENLQAVFYRTLAAARFRDFKPTSIRITFFYLVSATPVSITFKQEELVKRWQQVDATGEQIAAALDNHRSGLPLWEAFPLRRGERCRSCALRRHCNQLKPSKLEVTSSTEDLLLEGGHVH